MAVLQAEIAISIHAPLARCDIARPSRTAKATHFNPRTSCEVRPGRRRPHFRHNCHFNPRTSCEVRPERGQHQQREERISIHAPLARCDGYRGRRWRLVRYFNPRTSCEVRLRSGGYPAGGYYFNPRTSCEVRQRRKHRRKRRNNFNPRTSCEVRPCFPVLPSVCSRFQSTHLLRGATALHFNAAALHCPFQSTHLLRGAT